MAGADHGGQLSFPPLWVDGVAERAEPPSPRKSQGGFDRFGARKILRLGRILFANARRRQGLTDTSFAIAASRERPRLGERIGLVINIAEPGKPFDQPLHIR